MIINLMDSVQAAIKIDGRYTGRIQSLGDFEEREKKTECNRFFQLG